MPKENVKVCSFYFCMYVLCTAVDCIPKKTIKVFFFFLLGDLLCLINGELKDCN